MLEELLKGLKFRSLLKVPLTVLVLAGLIGFAPIVFSLPERWLQFGELAAKLLAVAAFAIFVQKLLLTLHANFIATREAFRTYSGIIRIVVSVVVYGIFLLIFLDTAGISITPLVASLGMGSVAVALALQETLASLFSGVYILADKPIRVGDLIYLESGDEGYVESIGWRSVRIRLPSDVIVVIPNSKLAGSVIKNYYYPTRELSFAVQLGVDYGSDLEKVEQVTLEVAREVLKQVEGGVIGFEPFVRYHTFGDSSINFLLMLRARQFEDKAKVIHELLKRLHRRYQQEGISIPFPTRTVYLNQPKQ